MKSRRHRKILEIIQEKQIATQEELANELKTAGFNVTQATVSRDIKELALIKVSYDGEQYRYAEPSEDAKVSDSRLRFMLREFVINFDSSENMLVIRTPPGNANAVASAIDKAQWHGVLGTIAGDDTILMIIKHREDVARIIEKIQGYLE